MASKTMTNWEQCKYLCPYCGNVAPLVQGDVVYPHRPDLAELNFYFCKDCEAWVGCHKGTIEPFGRLAKAELRRLKQEAHRKFDLLWKKGPHKQYSRKQAYKALAKHMDKDKHITHIGWFNEAECEEVIRWVNDKLTLTHKENQNL